MADRREALDSVVNQIDSKVGDLDQRLKRFSALLQETFEAAEGPRPRHRARARRILDRRHQGDRQPVRAGARDQRRGAQAHQRGAALDLRAGDRRDLHLFRQTSERFVEIVRQMREMSAAMQREMETTRTELRRGILELPQETAESAAQMRRVIVEQIDALAELNRIVARHSRDAVEPAAAGVPSRCGGLAAERRCAPGRVPPGAGWSRSAAAAAIRRRAASGAAGAAAAGRPRRPWRRLAVRPARTRLAARRRRAAGRRHPPDAPGDGVARLASRSISRA